MTHSYNITVQTLDLRPATNLTAHGPHSQIRRWINPLTRTEEYLLFTTPIERSVSRSPKHVEEFMRRVQAMYKALAPNVPTRVRHVVYDDSTGEEILVSKLSHDGNFAPVNTHPKCPL